MLFVFLYFFKFFFWVQKGPVVQGQHWGMKGGDGLTRMDQGSCWSCWWRFRGGGRGSEGVRGLGEWGKGGDGWSVVVCSEGALCARWGL